MHQTPYRQLIVVPDGLIQIEESSLLSFVVLSLSYSLIIPALSALSSGNLRYIERPSGAAPRRLPFWQVDVPANLAVHLIVVVFSRIWTTIHITIPVWTNRHFFPFINQWSQELRSHLAIQIDGCTAGRNRPEHSGESDHSDEQYSNPSISPLALEWDT